MKKSILIIIISIVINFANNAQVITKHVSKNVIENRIRHKKHSSISKVTMPSINRAALLAEDKEEIKLGFPFRFGYSFDVNLNLQNSGYWNELHNGNRVWTINIVSKGAYSINLAYNKFFIPDGGELYIYNEDKTILQGPITSKQNTPNLKFSTDLVQGESIILEYYEPIEVKEKVR
jgi:hypothetical protein